MLAVIPQKAYRELMQKTVSEADSAEFSVNNFSKAIENTAMENIREVAFKYLRSVDVKFIGMGSARVAFFIPPGSVSKDKSIPCCLKLAMNEAGIAQNKAEIKLIREFEGLPCFPEIFNVDEKFRFILTEVGTKCSEEFARKTIYEYNDAVEKLKNVPPVKESSLKIGFDRDDVNVKDIVTFSFQFCIRGPFRDPKLRESSIQNSVISKVIDPVCEKNIRLEPIEGIVLFANLNGWGKSSSGDIQRLENWAIVTRENIQTMIPIDWGLNNEVFDQYYKY